MRKKMQLCIVCGTYWKTCYCAQKQRRESLLRAEMMADLASATAAKIEELRRALEIQVEEVRRNVQEKTYVSEKEPPSVQSNGASSSPEK